MDIALTPSDWAELPSGTTVSIVKLRPDGSQATTYPATVIDVGAPSPWIAVEAFWTRPTTAVDGLVFSTYDRIHEYFSNRHPFNVFAVFSGNGTMKGWYANVTHPAWMGFHSGTPAIFWHDLFVDVVGLPDGERFVRDEDELAAARTTVSEALYQRIHAARDEILCRLELREFPFHES